MKILSNDDKIIIAKRLRLLREQKGLSFERLYQELKKNGIKISIQALKDYEVDKEYHSKFNSTKGMKLESLYNLAQFYNVSVDYILGNTNIKSQTMDVRMICSYTGLSEDTVTYLHNCIQKEKNCDNKDKIIDCLLQSENLCKAIEIIVDLIQSRGENTDNL